MRYKIGQRVLVRKDLDRYKEYCMEGGFHSNSVSWSMFELKGKVVIIREYVNGDMGYRIEGDSYGWVWTDDMLELSNEINFEVKKGKEETKNLVERAKKVFSNPFTVAGVDVARGGRLPSVGDYLYRWGS